MNKMLKLPIFLGVVGGICGALLSATNMITAPIISQNEVDRANAAYRKHFPNLKTTDITTNISSTILERALCKDDKDAYIGVVYKIFVKGYDPSGATFSASFVHKNDNVVLHKFIDLGNKESNQGADFLNDLYKLSDVSVESLVEIKSGTVTFNAVVDGLNACREDARTNFVPLLGGN